MYDDCTLCPNGFMVGDVLWCDHFLCPVSVYTQAECGLYAKEDDAAAQVQQISEEVES